MIIYCITNLITNKKYIGQTRRKMQRRWRQHITSSHLGSLIGNSIQKHGEENFKIEQIDSASSIEELNIKEVFWINNLKTLKPAGYNLTTGGDSNYTLTDLTKEKISRSWKTRKVSDETKKRMSLGHKKMLKENPELLAKKIKQLAKGYGWNKGLPAKNRHSIICIETDRVFNSITDAAKTLKLDVSSVAKVVKGILKQTGGYTFKRIKQ